MEKEGFERCFTELSEEGVVISRIATDRHTSIASTMDKTHQDTCHQYDVWHVSKWVVKKLQGEAKVKACEDLAPWIRSVANHLWWCSATCEGSVDVLQEKWKSILHHVTNKHEWRGCTHIHKCSHPTLSARQMRKKKWLVPGTPPHIALEEVVTNTKLLKDMSKLTQFCHTGELEVYHSLILKYCPKREHFSFRGMLARTQLTALDQNAHAGRQQAVASSGEHRYKISFPKPQKQWVIKPIKEKKYHNHIHELMGDLVDTCLKGGEEAQEPAGRNLPPNIAPTPAPSKEQLLLRHRSRFRRWVKTFHTLTITENASVCK